MKNDKLFFTAGEDETFGLGPAAKQGHEGAEGVRMKVNAYFCGWYWEGENGENRVAGSAIVGELALTPAFDLLPHRLEVALHHAEPDVDGVGEDEVL